MASFFGSNLVFGFVFGSVAKRRATHRSDIDTMVVLHRTDEEQTEHYLCWLRQYHQEVNMKVDYTYPVEIVTRQFLDECLASLERITMNIESTDPQTLDIVVWVEVLTGVKRGIVGDINLLFAYAKKVGKYPKIWKRQVLCELERRLEHVLSDDEDGYQNALQQLDCIRRLQPHLVLKRFIGLEHLSVDQRNSIRDRVVWSHNSLSGGN